MLFRSVMNHVFKDDSLPHLQFVVEAPRAHIVAAQAGIAAQTVDIRSLLAHLCAAHRRLVGITPETSEERIRFIDRHTDGFIYMVSSAAVTGAQKSFDDAKQQYFRRINAMNLRNPRMIGFGISNRQTLESAQRNAAGTIIGSKFVTLLNESANADEALDKLFEALG